MSIIKNQEPGLGSCDSIKTPLHTNLLKESETAQFESSFGAYLDHRTAPIVIIGAGPVGIRCGQLLLNKRLNREIIVYGNEDCNPYNRVRLSDYIAGRIGFKDLDNSIESVSSQLKPFYSCRVTAIDPAGQCVIDEQGRRQNFSKLIIATGSSANLPNIKGLASDCIYSLRTLEDAEQLIRLKNNIRHLLIIGGGFLGIETAAGMRSKHLKVTLISSRNLLNRYIDVNGSQILQDYIHALGVEVYTNSDIRFCSTDKKGHQLTLSNGRIIKCDAVFAATGSSPNIQLAKQAGLEIGRGIVVDQYMRSSHRNIYAVGDCAEYSKQLVGLIAPGYEQAETVVNHIQGRAVPYTPVKTNTRVKVLDKPVIFFGELNDQHCKKTAYANSVKGEYRCVYTYKNRIVGYTAIGEWDQNDRIRSAVINKKRFFFWQKKRFLKKGHIWAKYKKRTLDDLPEDYVICLCKNITRGQITASMNAGNRTIDSLCRDTSAGITCGSCRPLLGKILKAPVEHLVMRHHRKILWTSFISALFILSHFIFKPFDISLTVQGDWKIEKLWFDSGFKQLSGYSLLIFFALGAALALRKRWKKLKIGNMDNWRFMHGVIGAIALGLLLLHTGFRLGENLNMYLMLAFLLATLTGSVVGILMSTSHHWPEAKLELYRRHISRVHYTILWVIPSLLLFHIVSVYYF